MAHRVSPRAEADLDEIWEYIAEESGYPSVAQRLIDSITDRFILISEHLYIGRSRPELQPELRSHAVGNDLIFYRVQDDEVLIVRVLQGAATSFAKARSMPSHIYNLFAEAMAGRKQILRTYDGCKRELGPIILGHSRGEEVALTFQFGGRSSQGLPPGGAWKCLFLTKVRDVHLRDGPWRTGDSHR